MATHDDRHDSTDAALSFLKLLRRMDPSEDGQRYAREREAEVLEEQRVAGFAPNPPASQP